MNAPDRAALRLTQFSHGGGCGCKLAPAVLQRILGSVDHPLIPKELLDAATARECFGGVLDKPKMSLGHRLITKMMESVNKKEGKAGPVQMAENIKKLARAMA
jgi:hypothetical protein